MRSRTQGRLPWRARASVRRRTDRLAGCVNLAAPGQLAVLAVEVNPPFSPSPSGMRWGRILAGAALPPAGAVPGSEVAESDQLTPQACG